VAPAWALLATVILAIGLFHSERQFRFQAYLLGALVAIRASLHNLFLLETFAGWSARLLTVGAVTAILFGCFFLIHARQRGRRPEPAPSAPGSLAGVLYWIDRNSRYLYFFVPMALLTVLLAAEVRAGLLTLAWGLEGLALFTCGFLIGERPFRLSGLLLLVVCIGRIFLLDLRGSNLLYRIASFVALGAILLLVSFLYTHHRERINRYL
jgi:uncharacterized membrane protein